jgi:uridine kinase
MYSSNEEPCCVVVIFGIPGAGKSYLSRGLVSRADKVFGGRSRVIHVHMDDYYPIDNRGSNEPSIENDLDVGFNWKRSRQSVTGHIEDILSGTMSSHNPLLQCHSLVVADHGSSNILIVDDNLPLRAMRHEYYQLARKCNAFNVISDSYIPQ